MSYTEWPKNNKKIALKICWYRQRVYICYTNNEKQMKKRFLENYKQIEAAFDASKKPGTILEAIYSRYKLIYYTYFS